MKIKFIFYFLLTGLFACKSDKDKLFKAIVQLESSDSSSTPDGFNKLADMYYEYAKSFPADSFSENYLYKGFMYKYLTNHWDDAIKLAAFYKNTYVVSENYHRINLKLADVYNTGKNNSDSALRYYLLANEKVEFSTDDKRKAANTFEKWAIAHKESQKSADLLFYAARFYQSCGDFNQAVKTYRSVVDNYSDFSKCPDALMAAGFISWNDLKDQAKARRFYQELAEKYPNHPLGKEAKTILSENIMGMSDLELSEYLMNKNQSKTPVQ